MSKHIEYSFQANIGALQSRTLDGDEYYVVPVVMLKEGVWNNVFYSKEELKSTSVAWNGVDLLVDHPMNEDGSIKNDGTTPEVWERQGVGKVWNVTVDEQGNLKADAWFNKKKLSKFSALSRMLHSGATLEFSTGLFGRVSNKEGEENPYVSPIIPDHLAVLPDKKGACSVADGCGGPRYNQIINFFSKTFEKIGIKKSEEAMFTDSLINKLKSEYNIEENDSLLLENLINEDDNGKVIFSIKRNEADFPEFYEQNFSYDEGNSKIELTDDPEKVEKLFRKVSEKSDNINNNTGGIKMGKQKIIDNMVDNGLFNGGDREFLNGLSEDQLEALKNREENREDPELPELSEMLSNVSENEENEAVKAASEAYNAVVNGDNKEPETIDEFVAGAPEKFKEVLQSAVSEFDTKKEAIVNSLAENDRCDFEKEELESKTLKELESLRKLANVKVSYKGNENEDPDPSKDEDKVPLPPKLNFGKSE